MTGPPDFDLHQVFVGQEEVLRKELQLGARAGHSGVQGTGTEGQWLELLSKRLPRRYAVTKAIVIDSAGGRSQQLDLVIHDRQYSPRFWEWGDHHFVPAESVYAVFEVKPEINRDYILYAGEKVASVRALSRTSSSFGWAQGEMTARKDFEPLGGIVCAASGWSPTFGDPFRAALRDVPQGGRLDLGCVLAHGAFEVQPSAPNDDVELSEAQVTLVTFLLTLLDRLKALGTAPAIDYGAYRSWIDGAASTL